jgi:hypothetical protein
MLIISTLVLVTYLIVLFQLVVDLFRDSELGGVSKVLWMIGLMFLPILTAVIYIIARGRGMADRQRASMQRAKSDTDAYIRAIVLRLRFIGTVPPACYSRSSSTMRDTGVPPLESTMCAPCGLFAIPSHSAFGDQFAQGRRP